jgi:hypothetical protein
MDHKFFKRDLAERTLIWETPQAMADQQLISDVLNFLEILPTAERGSLEEQFRETVYQLCLAVQKRPAEGIRSTVLTGS